MILTVTPNVALDITYRVDQLTPGLSHRVRSVEERAGGKGVNVARAFHALGHDTFVLGLVGGATAGTITTDLARGGLGHELVLVEGPTRRSIAVVDARNQEATLFNEPGPRVAAPSWSDLEARLAARLPEATALVVSGSLPPASVTTPVPGSCAWPPRTGWWSWSTPSVRRSSRPPPPGPTS